MHAYQMLTSRDEKIQKIAIGQMLEVIACKCRIGVYPSSRQEACELIAAFVNGTKHSNLVPLGRGSHDVKSVFGSLQHNFKMCDLKLELKEDGRFGLVLGEMKVFDAQVSSPAVNSNQPLIHAASPPSACNIA